MAEDILADLMGSFLIVAPAVLGVVFAYWLFKKVRRRGTPPDRRRARPRMRFQRRQRRRPRRRVDRTPPRRPVLDGAASSRSTIRDLDVDARALSARALPRPP